MFVNIFLRADRGELINNTKEGQLMNLRTENIMISNYTGNSDGMINMRNILRTGLVMRNVVIMVWVIRVGFGMNLLEEIDIMWMRDVVIERNRTILVLLSVLLVCIRRRAVGIKNQHIINPNIIKNNMKEDMITTTDELWCICPNRRFILIYLFYKWKWELKWDKCMQMSFK